MRVVVYVLIVIAVAVAVAAAVPKVLGPLAEAWRSWVDERRRLAIEADDADIAEKNRIIKSLRDELARRDAYLVELDTWAWSAYYALRQSGIELPQPPQRYVDRQSPAPADPAITARSCGRRSHAMPLGVPKLAAR